MRGNRLTGSVLTLVTAAFLTPGATPAAGDLTLDPVEGDPSRTLVRFRHYGFGKGPLWEKSFHWFERAWAGVLGGLKTACEKSR
jgi:hypothetical protein